MIAYFKELLSEIRKIRLELEQIRLSVSETEKAIGSVSGRNDRGQGYIRNGGKYD